MPIIKHSTLKNNSEIGVWRMDEPADWFTDKMDLHPEEHLQLSTIFEPKKCEWLAARWLLHEMSGREIRGKVLKDAFGKPHLEESTWHISLSHSADCAAVIAGPKSVGIDIQALSPKINRLAERFMSTEELKNVDLEKDLEKIHVYWGAKESLYKLYGKGKLDFRSNLVVHDFDYQEKGKFHGRIINSDYTIECNLQYEKINDYMLVWACAPF